METPPISVRLRLDLLKKVDEARQTDHLSRSVMLGKIIEDFFVNGGGRKTQGEKTLAAIQTEIRVYEEARRLIRERVPEPFGWAPNLNPTPDSRRRDDERKAAWKKMRREATLDVAKRFKLDAEELARGSL